MPELPEVETIRRGLSDEIVGRRIAGIEQLHPKSFQSPDRWIKKYAVGAEVVKIDRRGKILILELDTGYSLLFHLKMTGQLVLVRSEGDRYAGGHPTPSIGADLPDKSSKVIFFFDDGSRLFFNDQRVFGWVKLVPNDEVLQDSLIARLGPEPLTPNFEIGPFAKVLSRRAKSPIKAVILDQTTVAGVGNIYADEALHLAKIHPATPAGALSHGQVKRLYEAVKTIIALGVRHGGTSFTSYVNALGGKGDYLQTARVFRRQGLSCPVCGTTIVKTRVAGRGTHFCPRCQRPPA